MKIERRFLFNNRLKLFYLICNPLFFFLILGNPFSISNSIAKISQNDSCPMVWVAVLPVLIEDSPADHTYVTALDNSGNASSWGCFGRKSGGKELNETKSRTFESNLIIIEGLADKKPCKWDKKFYGKIGVCHQLANRALYFTGKTVKNAKMYKTSSVLYGTYGNSYPKAHDFDMAECLRDKFKNWKEGYSSYCDRETGEKLYSGMDKEVALFNEFFGKKSIKLIEIYNVKLTELYINTRLGVDFFHKAGKRMINYRFDMLKEIEKLNQRTDKSTLKDEEIVRAYNQNFNNYFDKHKSFMSENDFFAFFGWDSKKTFDIRWLLEN